MFEDDEYIQAAEENAKGLELLADAGIDIEALSYPTHGNVVVDVLRRNINEAAERLNDEAGDVFDELASFDTDERRKMVRIANKAAKAEIELYEALFSVM